MKNITVIILLAMLAPGLSAADKTKAEAKADPSILVIAGDPGCSYEVKNNVFGVFGVDFGSKHWRGNPGQYLDAMSRAIDAARIYAKEQGGDAVIHFTIETVGFSDGVINSDRISNTIGIVKIFGTVVKLKKDPSKTTSQ